MTLSAMMAVLLLEDETVTQAPGKAAPYLCLLVFSPQYFKAFTKDFTTGENFKGKDTHVVLHSPRLLRPSQRPEGWAGLPSPASAGSP